MAVDPMNKPKLKRPEDQPPEDIRHEKARLPALDDYVVIYYGGEPQAAELERIAKELLAVTAKVKRRFLRSATLESEIQRGQRIDVAKLQAERLVLLTEHDRLGGGGVGRGKPFRTQKRKIRGRLHAIERDLAAAVPATIDALIAELAAVDESLRQKRTELAQLSEQGRALERCLPPSKQKQLFGADT